MNTEGQFIGLREDVEVVGDMEETKLKIEFCHHGNENEINIHFKKDIKHLR